MNQVEVKRRQAEVCSLIIGLIGIIIFGNILGDDGIAHLLVVLECFLFARVLIWGNLSDSLGKMLRMRISKGQYKNAASICKRVLFLEGIVGVISSILFALCAELVAGKIFTLPHSGFIMLVLAPALCLQTISAILIGFFKGEGNELPAVVVAPLRQLAILGFGILFTERLGEYGAKVSALLGEPFYKAMYGCIGIVLAINVAEILVLIFLIMVTVGNKKSQLKRGGEGLKQKDSFVNIIRVLYGSMWPMMLLSLLELLPLLSGTMIYRKNVTDVRVFTANFSLYAGKYLTGCGILVLLVCAMLLTVNAKTVSSLRKEDYRGAKMSFQSGLHIAVVLGLYFTVFAAVTEKPIAGMAALIFLAILYFYFSGLLLRFGKKFHLLICSGAANIIFAVVLLVLMKGENVTILSVAYAGIVAMIICVLVLGFLCCKILHVGIDWLQVVAVPVGAVCVTGLTAMFLEKLLSPHLGAGFTAFVCFVVTFILYWVILLLCRSFREQELRYIPGSRIIRAAGQTLHVFDMD